METVPYNIYIIIIYIIIINYNYNHYYEQNRGGGGGGGVLSALGRFNQWGWGVGEGGCCPL